jgi:hypothetical protein
MTSTIHLPSSTAQPAPPAAARSTDARRLRAVLRANATTSALAGAAAVLAPNWSTRMLGAGTATVARTVGVVLLAFAAEVALVASGRLRRPGLATAARLVSAVDVAWVAASITVIATGALSGRGVAIGVVQALAVADFALGQLLLARRLGH